MSAPSAPALPSGTVVAGRYRVEHQLGQGGMGSVFLVQHVHTDERLAMKLLHSTVVQDSATLDRFRREARTPARIDSDHVVRVTDADVAPELNNVPFLVMEYLRGEDLEHLAKRRGPLPPAEVVVLLGQAARALDKAHALGIVHRDLKPENLFVTQREDGTPNVKILDFGIAKMTGNASVQDAGRLTATGQIFGTPLYMSPEQALAESEKLCPQSDIWAVGLIAHRLLHGKEFWTAETLTHLVAQIAFEPLPSPSDLGSTLGPAYDEWFARCVNRDIASRFKSASEAVSALAAALRVTDSPSQIARIPVSVRPSGSHAANDVTDALAATSASEAVTAPTNPSRSPSPPPVGRTQFGAEAPKPARPRALGLVVGGVVAVVAGGLLAWQMTAPPAAPAAPTDTGAPAATTVASAAPKPTITPVVTPSPEIAGEITVTTEPAPTSSAGAGTPAPPATPAPVKTTAPATTTTTAPAKSTAATATTSAPAPPATSSAPTTAPPAASTTTFDPLGSRR